MFLMNMAVEANKVKLRKLLYKRIKENKENKFIFTTILSTLGLAAVGYFYFNYGKADAEESYKDQVDDWAGVITFAKDFAYSENEDRIYDCKDPDHSCKFTNIKTIFDDDVGKNIKVLFSYVKKLRAYIITFRGSKTADNWKSNAEITQINSDFGASHELNSHYIHTGFSNNFLRVAKKIDEVVKNFLNETKDAFLNKMIIFNGHSLGGALATICAGYLIPKIKQWGKDGGIKEKPESFHLITFGSPRVGDKKFAQYINTTIEPGLNIRVVYGDDIVTRIPPWLPVAEYYHSGTLVNFPVVGDFEIHDLNSDTKTIAKDTIDVLKFVTEFSVDNLSDPFFWVKNLLYICKAGIDHTKYSIIDKFEFAKMIVSYAKKFGSTLKRLAKKMKLREESKLKMKRKGNK